MALPFNNEKRTIWDILKINLPTDVMSAITFTLKANVGDRDADDAPVASLFSSSVGWVA